VCWEVALLDLIVIIPHVLAVLVVVSWLLHARRFKEADTKAGEDGSGGKRTRPPIPQLPLIGGQGTRGDLARSA
jgi:hypothetical protein